MRRIEKIEPWHTNKSRVYHYIKQCVTGDDVPPEERVLGKGEGRTPCPVCESMEIISEKKLKDGDKT